MQIPPSYPCPESASKGTATSSRAFVETIEYNRFVEFCEACRQLHRSLLRTAPYRPDSVSRALQPRGPDRPTRSVDERSE
jgi:hypothetical protein